MNKDIFIDEDVSMCSYLVNLLITFREKISVRLKVSIEN